MPFKNPNLTIEAAGSLPAYVDAFLGKRGVADGWQKFVTLLSYKRISRRSRANELGIAVNTFKHWEHLYREENRDSSQTDKHQEDI